MNSRWPDKMPFFFTLPSSYFTRLCTGNHLIDFQCCRDDSTYSTCKYRVEFYVKFQS